MNAWEIATNPKFIQSIRVRSIPNFFDLSIKLNLNVDDILGLIVGNVDSWDFFGNGAAPAVSGGDRIVVLPLLRANTWTTFPAPTDGSVVNDYSILDSAKRDITHTVEIEPDGDAWKVRSLVEKTNLQFRYELGAKP
jgi:hypothetical protein